MRKHPAIEAWFVHNALLSEVAESTILSTDRKQGCVISEEGTRVALVSCAEHSRRAAVDAAHRSSAPSSCAPAALASSLTLEGRHL
ncbi:hypothetical protein OESDEN_14753 [Oesophagostomum dentatum]|uniref:Uncharacterized protein n=1 Tax=Oesophagostomum dentatum TaxID=61180 RepID=A0A0B1SKS2_OESDE|nr:hypothetical protein OESDEN_14753 [Oesophagostomum dentatum]